MLCMRVYYTTYYVVSRRNFLYFGRYFLLKFPERLKSLRLEKDITQKELALCIGVTSTSIQRFEYGTGKPALDTVVALADFFKVSVDYLLGRVDNPNFEKSFESLNLQDVIIEQVRQAGYDAVDKKLRELFPTATFL